MAEPRDERPRMEPVRLAQTSWWQHLARFAFGGVATACAGWVARAFGPEVGGLFLAFPAILPAALSVVKQHDGKQAAGEEARGAVLGSIGLVAFALVVWRLSGRLAPWGVLVLAMVVWLAVSGVAWLLHRRTSA